MSSSEAHVEYALSVPLQPSRGKRLQLCAWNAGAVTLAAVEWLLSPTVQLRLCGEFVKGQFCVMMACISCASEVRHVIPYSEFIKLEGASMVTVAEFAAMEEELAMLFAGRSLTRRFLVCTLPTTLCAAAFTATAQELIALGSLACGTITASEFAAQSVTVAATAATTVGGGTIGAAIGSLFCFGPGTAIGSFVGSYVGGFLPWIFSARAARKRIAEENATAAARPLLTLPAMDGEWVEVVDVVNEQEPCAAAEGSAAVDNVAQTSS